MAGRRSNARKPGFESGKHGNQRGRASPIRVGFVLRSFTYGGAEHDIIQLITAADPQVLEVTGLAVQTPFPICPDLPLDHPRVPPIYQPGAVTQHRKVVSSDSFALAVESVAERADIIVTWGVADLADWLPLDFRGRIVVTSKASGEYQEGFLHSNALLTSDYVANSFKSVEAFPSPVRHRTHVIYPGIDPRRIECTRDRNDQRAAWGFSSKDRVVGYLGRIAPDKGIEQLVTTIRDMGAEWKAVIVGRNGNFGEYERRFARLCRRMLPGRHRIVDWMSDIGNALTAFDVLAYPTEDEGFSNTLAEAWLLGVPTVSTAGVGALAEPHWADCAITVARDFTSRELSRALAAALDNKRLAARAQRRARALTVKNTLRQWQRYFSQLVAQQQRTRVMVLLPNLMIGGIPSWLQTLMGETPLIDWCCLCVMSESADYAADSEMVAGILQQGCPVLGIPQVSTTETKRRLLRAMRQTRPDVVLQSGVKGLDERYPDIDIPLITVSHGPSACTWARDVLANSSKRATHRVAISATSKNAFPRSFRAGVRVITNGVPIPALKDLGPKARGLARRELGIDKREVAVGFVGRLSAEKNPLSVAQAVATLSPEYRAVFIGPDCDNLLAKIREVAPRSLYLGPISPLTVGKLMPGLDVLVCPSDYESFGLAIVEAWASKVPVVSTRVGVVAELVDELDVAVVIPYAPTGPELARAIQQAHQEREKRIPICRVLAMRDYDARRMGRDWQEFLLDAGGRRMRHPPIPQLPLTPLTDSIDGGRIESSLTPIGCRGEASNMDQV